MPCEPPHDGHRSGWPVGERPLDPTVNPGVEVAFENTDLLGGTTFYTSIPILCCSSEAKWRSLLLGNSNLLSKKPGGGGGGAWQPSAAAAVGLETDMTCSWGRVGPRVLSPASEAGQGMQDR